MKKLTIILLISLLLLSTVAAAAGVGYAGWTLMLKGNQSVTIQCQGDELIIQPYGDTELLLTCRTWLR